MLKAATDRFGITPVNVFQLKAVARAAAITGVPVTTHTIAADRLGLEQALILEKAGVDLSKVAETKIAIAEYLSHIVLAMPHNFCRTSA